MIDEIEASKWKMADIHSVYVSAPVRGRECECEHVCVQAAFDSYNAKFTYTVMGRMARLDKRAIWFMCACECVLLYASFLPSN